MEERGYSLLEPDIYEKLDWDLDLIVACLDTIRKELSTILNIDNNNVEYDLLAMTNFLGNVYPVIGIYNLPDYSPDLDDIDKMTNDWINKIGIDKLIKISSSGQTITWKELEIAKTYPNRKHVERN